MSLYNPPMHENFVPGYQVSAVPYVTASQISLGETQTHTFSFVTRFFNVKNRGATAADVIVVSFTENGLTTGNYFTLEQGESFRDEIRCTSLFVSCSNGSNVDYEIVAGLTSIPARNMLLITGSNGYEGVG